MFAFFICCGSLEQAIALMCVPEMFFQLPKYTQILSMYHSVQVEVIGFFPDLQLSFNVGGRRDSAAWAEGCQWGHLGSRPWELSF